MGLQVLACYSGRVRNDKNERKDARHRTVVDPGVHRAALNDDITGFQMLSSSRSHSPESSNA
jgi:hypothetical protein